MLPNIKYNFIFLGLCDRYSFFLFSSTVAPWAIILESVVLDFNSGFLYFYNNRYEAVVPRRQLYCSLSRMNAPRRVCLINAQLLPVQTQRIDYISDVGINQF
jgi:hypothetical protein